MVIEYKKLFITSLMRTNIKKNTFLDTKVRNFTSKSKIPIFRYADGQKPSRKPFLDGHCSSIKRAFLMSIARQEMLIQSDTRANKAITVRVRVSESEIARDWRERERE